MTFSPASAALWALALRGNQRATPLRAALARCISPHAHAPALAMPAIARRVAGASPAQVPAVLTALSLISLRTRNPHNTGRRLGEQLSGLRGSNFDTNLALAVTSTHQVAARVLSNGIDRLASAPVNFIELTERLTSWDAAASSERMSLLIDYHGARA